LNYKLGNLTDMNEVCPQCGSNNPTSATFCKSCGNQFSLAVVETIPVPAPPTPPADWVNYVAGPSIPQKKSSLEHDPNARPAKRSTAASRISRTPKRGFGVGTLGLGVFALVVAIAAGGYYWYQRDLMQKATAAARLRQDAESKRQAELQQQAQLEAARISAEDAERDRERAARKAAQLATEQAAAAQVAQNAKTAAKAVRDRAAKEVIARQQAKDIAEREAKARRQAESDAAVARIAAGQAVTSAPTPIPVAPVPQIRQTGPESPEAICAATTNFFSRAICESRECSKPNFFDSNYCKVLRERASRNQSNN
jgi:hypothetical protein